MMQGGVFKKACSVAAVFFFAFSTLAQYDTSAFYVKRYTAFDGLPDTYTLDIFQDSKQYMWIGTYSGLSRFDGTAFTNFGARNGFRDSYVSRFIEFNNHIWIGNRSSIGYLDKNQFVSTPFEDSAKRLFFVFGFKELQPGKLSVFTSKGLYEWDNKRWVKNKNIAELEEGPCLNAMALNGVSYFFFFDKIILQYNNGKKEKIPAPGNDKEYFQWAEQFNDQLIVLTKDGLHVLNGNRLQPLFHQALHKKTITSFFRDSEKKIWVATREDGLLVSKPGETRHFSYRVAAPSKYVFRIFEDKSHTIWAADYEGLFKIRRSFFEWPLFQNPRPATSQLFPFTDTKGQLNIFNARSGLMVYAGGKFSSRKFIHDKFHTSPLGIRKGIEQVCYDKDENAWIVTRSNKLVQLTPEGEQRELQIPFPKGAAPVSVAWSASQNRLFCGANELYTFEEDSFRLYIPPNTGKPLEYISSLYVLQNGNLLVNSRVTGLWVITKSGNAYNAGKKIGAAPDTRMNFAEDNNGKLWIAFTGTGLQSFRWVSDTIPVKEAEVTTLNNGLPNDIVETMIVDKKNRVWAATLAGVVVIDTLAGSGGKSFITYNISKIEKLNTEVSIGLTHLTADPGGDIWFCSDEKIIRFRAGILDLNSLAPVTHIEEMRLNMKTTDWSVWSKDLDNYFMLPRDLSLPYKQNTLTFTFKGINHSSDDNIWYSYKLTNVDTTWGPATLSNAVTFMKLIPGDFTFMVRSRNSNSPWSEPVSFSFTIRKPFWQTWWFRLIGIFLASLILALLFRVQLKRIRKRAALENQFRTLEMKALKAQMNPHFIYNALNSIQSLVIDDKKTDALDYMVKFGRLLRQVLNHSELTIVPLSKELDSLTLYIQLESLRLNYSLQYSISLDENIIAENEMVPPLILQPFVENALWHGLGNKQGDKILTINITGEENALLFEIIDNGIGRVAAAGDSKPEEYKEGPRGMHITENRLIFYNEKAPGKGIIIEDLYDTAGNPSGTKINLRIRRQ